MKDRQNVLSCRSSALLWRSTIYCLLILRLKGFDACPAAIDGIFGHQNLMLNSVHEGFDVGNNADHPGIRNLVQCLNGFVQALLKIVQGAGNR